MLHLVIASLIGSLGLLPLPASAADSPGRIVVRFHAEGPHGLGECAEALHEGGLRFAPATADGSDSLDRLAESVGARRVRAVFRHPDGRGLAARRDELDGRWQRARSRRARAAADAPAPDLSHVYRIELAAGADPEAAAALYRSDPHVAWAQPDYAAVLDAAPDDPFYASSGSWGNPYPDLWGLFQIDAETAWEASRGEGIVVAVVDSGIDPDHPDIRDNLWVNPGEDLDGNGSVDASDWNGLDDDGNGLVDDLRGYDFLGDFDVEGDGDPDPFDDFGHGTHVSGTIAAVGDNGIGIVGVAHRARIMALKGFDAEGRGTFVDLARAIAYAVEMGADVVSASWSCSERCPSNPLIEEVVRLAHGLGVVLVFSAGNRADDVVFYSPEKLRETIVVAATTPLDARSSSSNGGFLLDVAAPGADAGFLPIPAPRSNILSLRSSGASEQFDGGIVDGEYLRLSGTSMATPHVSGLAALLLAANPDYTNEDVRAALRLGADDLGAIGHDRDTGAGRIDAATSVALALPDARGAITSPAPGAIVNPIPGVLEVRGSVEGSEVAEYSLFAGRGSDPDVWLPIALARTQTVQDGVLGIWDVADLDVGGWLLRLEVVSVGGRVIEEFAPLSLERIVPRAISSPGSDALRPALSGHRVVWSSRRSGDPDQPADDLNLFASNLRSGTERLLSDAPGDQDFAALSGRNLAWLDSRGGGPPAVYRCRLGGRHCRARELAPPHESVSPPAVSGDRIVWSDDRGDGNGLDVRVCEIARGGACPPRTVNPDPAPQWLPDIDGDRIVWQQAVSGASDLYSCLFDPASGDCPASKTVPVPRIRFAPAVAGEIVAWEELGPSERMRACELDPASGLCVALVVEHPGANAAPQVSGRRVVWSAEVAGDDRSVFFCEYDAVRGVCPVQHLTGAAAGQRDPAIDGDRIVWEDGRAGASQILGVELPHLEVPDDRTVEAGRTLVIHVRTRAAADDPLRLRAEQADGEPVEALGARFEPRSPRVSRLVWRPAADQVGSHVFTFTATTRAGLESARSLRVEVLAP